MIYTLLKSGHVVSNMKVVKSDILIANGRIIDICETITPTSPNTKVFNAGDKYLLPGLPYYRSLNLDNGDELLSRKKIYLAACQGATFLFDVIKTFKGQANADFLKNLNTQYSNHIFDHGLHIDISDLHGVNVHLLSQLVIKTGMSSLFLGWKHIDNLLQGSLDNLLLHAAKLEMLLIIEYDSFASIPEGEIEIQGIKEKLNKQALGVEGEKQFVPYLAILDDEQRATNLKLLKRVVEHAAKSGIQLLIANVTSMDEIETIRDIAGTGNVSIAITPPGGINPVAWINTQNLLKLHQCSTIMFYPPEISKLATPADDKTGNRLKTSFITSMLNENKNAERFLPVICDMFATRPAKLLGIYPQKGALEPGSDADMIIWDSKASMPTWIDNNQEMNMPFDISGLIVNGEIFSSENSLNQTPSRGRYIYRTSVIQKT